MATILILAGIWLLIVLGILIGRGVKELRALEDEQRASADKAPERPKARASTKMVRRSGFNEK